MLVHGFAEHLGRYADLIAQLNRAGISVFAVDLRGHGRSHGARGYIDDLSQYEDDLDAAMEAARTRTGVHMITIVAHSMGGLVASCYAAKKPQMLSGLVLSSPLFAIAVKVPYWKAKLGQIMSSLLPAFALPNTLDAAHLTHDLLKVRAYQDDPLVFKYVRARWFERVSAITPEALSLAGQIQIPLLLQLSAEDYVVDFETSKRWFECLTGIDCTLKIYEGFYHEIYNEVRREEPIRDMLEWLARH